MLLRIKIFIVAIAIAFLDSLAELFFGNEGFMLDFSLMGTIIGLIYIVGTLILWVALLLESLALGDFLVPLYALIDIIMLFIAILGGGVISFIFELIALPFTIIANLLQAAGVNTSLEIWALGQVVSLDLETVTFRLGISAYVEANTGAWVTAQFTIFEVAESINELGAYDFHALDGFGMALFLQFKGLGQSLEPELSISLEGIIMSLFNEIKLNLGEPSELFDRILDQLRELGYRLGI